MERIVDTVIFSSSEAYKNKGNWNGAILVRSLTLSVSLGIPFSETCRYSFSISFSSVWTAGYGPTL